MNSKATTPNTEISFEESKDSIAVIIRAINGKSDALETMKENLIHVSSLSLTSLRNSSVKTNVPLEKRFGRCVVSVNAVINADNVTKEDTILWNGHDIDTHSFNPFMTKTFKVISSLLSTDGVFRTVNAQDFNLPKNNDQL